jgi:transcriptional regulator with XRE-family HTH domain
MHRGWNQEEFAKRLGMAQPRVSEMEHPGARRPNIETLLRIAEALDVGLQVRFVPFSELVEWSENFSPDTFSVPSFDEEIVEQTNAAEEATTELSAKAQYEIEQQIQKQMQQVAQQVNPYALSGKITTESSNFYMSYTKLNQPTTVEAASGLAKATQPPEPTGAVGNGIGLSNMRTGARPMPLVA